MGNSLQKEEKVFPLNKDTISIILQFLPLKNVFKVSVVSKLFHQSVCSEEMYEDLIQIHNIYIVKNNRTYNSFKEQLFKNILKNKSDRRTYPKWDRQRSQILQNRISKYDPLEILFEDQFKESLIELRNVFVEGFIHFKQVCKYSTRDDSQFFSEAQWIIEEDFIYIKLLIQKLIEEIDDYPKNIEFNHKLEFLVRYFDGNGWKNFNIPQIQPNNKDISYLHLLVLE
eukprot:gene9747-2074_t